MKIHACRIVAESIAREVDQFGFSLRLISDAHVNARLVTDTVRDVDALLRELEKTIDPDGKARATWQWSEPDPEVHFIASPNGASAETLAHVVSAAQEGFQVAASSEGQAMPEWPTEFSKDARRRAENILRRLSELQSLVVQATGYDPLRIEQANVGETVRARPAPRRLFSSVDGVLRVLTGGDTTVWAGLREHRTNHYVRCSFDAPTWKDRLGPLWEHRVVVEGMVAYDDERRPRSVVDIKRVTPRQAGRRMSELGGTAPNLTGGIDDDEFVALIRGHG